MPGHPVGHNYLKTVIFIIPVTFIVLAILYITHQLATPMLSEETPEQVEPFSHAVVLQLTEPVIDKEGLPYTGTVRYNPVSETYSYIAIEDGGVATPIGPEAFSPSSSVYLAMQGSDLVLFDSVTLLPVRDIQSFEIGTLPSRVAWSPDGSKIAYLVVGVPIPALMIEDVDSTGEPSSPGADIPLGFSPDGTKILTRGTSTPMLIGLGEDAFTYTLTSGVATDDPQTKLILSPSGQYLVSIRETVAEWYEVDWDKASFTSLGTVSLPPDAIDVLFTYDDSLLTRKGGEDTVDIYSYDTNTAEIAGTTFSLSLPDNSHIIHVVR